MTMYSTLIPCNNCAGAIVHFGIIEVVYGESRNLPEDNGRDLLVRYGVELADVDLEEARRMLRAFIETKPEEWSADIGRWARREDRTIGRSRRLRLWAAYRLEKYHWYTFDCASGCFWNTSCLELVGWTGPVCE